MASATLSNISTVQSKFVRILVDGERFDIHRLRDPSQSSPFQTALDNARHKFGYALCMCRPNSQKLQIRLREGKYHLAVWPEQGHLHDSGCIFFREEDETPATEIKAKVQVHEDGTREIKLTFALNRSIVALSPKPQNASRLTVDDHKLPEQASLRGLLHLLWHEASLTRWHPSWERDWGRARYELVQAAHRLTVKDTPLSERLFVPRPYRESIKDDLNREWDHFVANMAHPIENTIKSGLLIAPVRKFVELTGGAVSMHLRHLRSPIGLNQATFNFLKNNCKTAVRRVNLAIEEQERAKEPPRPGWIQHIQPEVVAIAHVETNSRGGVWARGVWLLLVQPTVFIPANNSDEIMLIDTLIKGEYQFSRLLTSEMPMQRTRPEWIVRHIYDPHCRPVPRAALEILNNGASPEYISKRAELADRMAKQGIPTWTWTPMGRQDGIWVPPLPPHDSMRPILARGVLDNIQNQRSVNYAFGSGREPNQP